MSPLAWIAIGAGVVLLVAVVISIAAYPRDNSF
jgi:hypothetical protein